MRELISRRQIEIAERPPTEKEREEIAGIPFSRLAEEAFDQLNGELTDNKLTPQLIEVLIKQSRRLLVFWKVQQEKFEKAKREGRLHKDYPDSIVEELIEEESRSSIMFDEGQVRSMSLETPKERNHINLWPGQSGPHIECEIVRSKRDPRWAVKYEIVYEKSIIMWIVKQERIKEPTEKEEYYVARKTRIDLNKFFRDRWEL